MSGDLLTISPVEVDPQTAAITIMGNRYWAPEMAALRGELVFVRTGPAVETVSVRELIGEREICLAHLVADAGFSAASVVRRETDVAHGEPHRSANEVLVFAGILRDLFCNGVLQKAVQLQAGTMADAGGDVFQRIEHGDQQDADFPGELLVHAEAALMHLQAFVSAHNQFRSPSLDPQQPATPSDDPHRLSGDAK